MDKRFKKKKGKKTKKRPSLLGKEQPSSDTYIERLKEAQRENIKVPEGANLDGYESDHAPTLPQRCGFTFRVKRLTNFSSSMDEDTAPPSPTPSMLDNVTPVSIPSNCVGVRYSLRSMIGDGTQQPDGPTVMERRHLRPNGSHLNVSHWSAEGLRPYMEDRYIIEELRIKKRNSVSSRSSYKKTFTSPMTCFAVFDGHGGDRASQFACDRLTTYLTYQPEYPHNIGSAMKHAYSLMDKDFIRTGLTDGTTACSCIVDGGERIICANAGDSRAITVRRDGSVARLSRDHKPGVPDETKRITELGGRIVYWGRWRVEGVLAVSRGIGDAALKPYITAEPDICEYKICDDDLFLVIATDGIWDVLDNLQVAEFILSESCLDQHGKEYADAELLKSAARRLCDKAGSLGSTDNLSAVIVDLKSHHQQFDYEAMT